MKNTDNREILKKLKRFGLFLLIVFIPAMVICILLIWAKVPQWLNILVLVLVLLILFGIYSWVYSKLDQKQQERLKRKKDPFSGE